MPKKIINLPTCKKVLIFQDFFIKNDGNDNKILKPAAIWPVSINFDTKAKLFFHLV